MKDSVSTLATSIGYGSYGNGYLSYCGRRTYTFHGIKTLVGGNTGPTIMTYYSNYYYK